MYGMEQMDGSAMTQINGESINFASIDGPKKPKNAQKVSENSAPKSLLTDEPFLESWKLHDMELDSEPETSSSDMNDADVLNLGASDDEDLLLEKDEFIAAASSKNPRWSSQTANKAKAIENNETSQVKKPIVLRKPLVKSSVRTPITFNGVAAAKPTPVRNALLPMVFGAKPGQQIPKMGAEQRISIGPQVLKPVLGPQVSKSFAVPRAQKPVAGPLMSKSVTRAQLSKAVQAISNWKIPVGTNVKVIQRADNDSDKDETNFERPMEWENLKISIPCSAGLQLKKRKILSDTVQTPVTASLSETFENNGQQNASSNRPAKMTKLANGPVPAIQCIPQIDRNRNLMNQKSSGMQTPSHGIRTIPATITSESGGPICQPPRQLLTIENGVVTPGSSSRNEPQRSVQPNNSLPETDLRHMIGQTSVKQTSGSTPSLSRAENVVPDLRTKISKSRSVSVVPIEVADEELDYDYSGMVALEDDTDLPNGPTDRKTTPVLQIEGQSLVNRRDPTPSDDEVSGYPPVDVQVNNPALPEHPPAESPSDDIFMGWQNETANVLPPPKHNPPKLVDRDPRKISSQLLKDFRDNTQPTTKLPESPGPSSQQISPHPQENNVKSSRTPQQRTPRIQKVIILPSNYIDIPLKPPRNDKIRYAPYIETPTVQRYGINVIFPHLCLKFARGKCFTNLAQCRLRHTFPKADVIRKSLDDLLSTDVANIYSTFLIRCPNLLRPYFAVFCDYFGSHGMENMLIEMIHQCETNVLNMANNLEPVHQGFIKSGKKYSAALESIIKPLRRKSTLHHALLKLILDERNDNYGYFLDTIMVLVEMDDVALDANDIDRLCVICKQYNNKPLYDAIFTIITKCQLDPTYVAVDSLNIEILTEFLEETSRKFLQL